MPDELTEAIAKAIADEIPMAWGKVTKVHYNAAEKAIQEMAARDRSAKRFLRALDVVCEARKFLQIERKCKFCKDGVELDDMCERCQVEWELRKVVAEYDKE